MQSSPAPFQAQGTYGIYMHIDYKAHIHCIHKPGINHGQNLIYFRPACEIEFLAQKGKNTDSL